MFLSTRARPSPSTKSSYLQPPTTQYSSMRTSLSHSSTANSIYTRTAVTLTATWTRISSTRTRLRKTRRTRSAMYSRSMATWTSISARRSSRSTARPPGVSSFAQTWLPGVSTCRMSTGLFSTTRLALQ